MRGFIAFSAIIASFILSYIKYNAYERIDKYNSFLLDFSTALIKNNMHEMLPLVEVFNKESEKHFNIKPSLCTNLEVIEYINERFSSCENFDIIFDDISKFTVAGEMEIRDAEKALIASVQEGKNSSVKKLNDYGRLSFVIYPAITAMVLLLLI